MTKKQESTTTFSHLKYSSGFFKLFTHIVAHHPQYVIFVAIKIPLPY